MFKIDFFNQIWEKVQDDFHILSKVFHKRFLKVQTSLAKNRPI